MNVPVSHPDNHSAAPRHHGQEESLQELVSVVENWALTQSQLWFTKFSDLLTQYLAETGKALGRTMDLDGVARAVHEQRNSFDATVSRLIRKGCLDKSPHTIVGRQMETAHTGSVVGQAEKSGNATVAWQTEENDNATIAWKAEKNDDLVVARRTEKSDDAATTTASLPRATRASVALPPSLATQGHILRKSTHAPPPVTALEESSAEPGSVRRSNRTHWNLPPDPDKGAAGGRAGGGSGGGRRSLSIPLPEVPAATERGGLRLQASSSEPPPARSGLRLQASSSEPPSAPLPPLSFSAPPPRVPAAPPSDTGAADLLIGILRSSLSKINSVGRDETRALAHSVTEAMETLQTTGGNLGDARNLEALKSMGDAFGRLRTSGLDTIPEIEGLGAALEKIAMFFGTSLVHDGDADALFSHPEPDVSANTARPLDQEEIHSHTWPGSIEERYDAPGSPFQSVLQDFFSGPGRRPPVRGMQQR
ncbi:MAG: hypothetical protein HQL64_11805 [Magnetococcales bacterium]|nr:hypothetical protein [Magnetococcales bacterium]